MSAPVHIAQGRAPRVLAYSHDGYGLGHLRRNLRIVAGLRRKRPEVQAMMVTGARSALRLTDPFGVECVQLPPVVKVANGRYAADGGAGSLAGVLSTRSALIADAVAQFRPDLLLVDRYPRGMHGELIRALRVHAAQGAGAHAVLGLRDILDDPSVIREEWRLKGHSDAIRETYATVLCYGDQRVYNSILEYGLPSDVANRIRFTGYLTDDLLASDALEVRHRHRPRGERLAVCTLGGGRDAGHIAYTFLAAMEQLGGRWCGVLITGPYMADRDVEALRRCRAAGRVSVIRMVDDLPSYLAAADAAVCMGGYNTTCELLALAVPAVIVPRVQPRIEQRMRAERMSARGLLQWVHPDRLSAARLTLELERAAAVPRSELRTRIEGIEHRGIQTASGHLAALLPAANATPASRSEVSGAA